MFNYALILLILTISAPSLAVNVVVDPGHGGHDHGAVKHNIKEAALTLKISKFLIEHLKADPETEYYLTRTKDVSLELKQRKQKAHNFKGDVFVSIHANASLTSRVRGVELYFQNILPPDQNSNYLANRENGGEDSLKGHRPSQFEERFGKSDLTHILDDMAKANYIKESYLFARTLKSRWQKEMNTKRVKIRQAPFYVVSSVNMPSLLVEIGYVTNPSEAKRLKSTRYQKKVAQVIYKSIKDFTRKNLNLIQ